MSNVDVTIMLEDGEAAPEKLIHAVLTAVRKNVAPNVDINLTDSNNIFSGWWQSKGTGS